jgi:Leucine-rich repeat (LRR) protein
MDTDHIIEYGSLRLWKLRSGQLQEGIERFRRKEFDGFSVSRHFGYNEVNLECLLKVPELRVLALSSAPKISLAALEEMPALEWLSIDDNEEPLDFSKLPNLQLLMFWWNKKRVLPVVGLDRLKDLTVWRFPHDDLSILRAYQSVEKLNMFQSRKLKTLDGVGSCRSLDRVSFAYCPELAEISSIATLGQLRYIGLENDQRIASYEAIGAVSSLQEVEIRKSAPVADLNFLRPLSRLRSLTIKNTKIMSEDLSALDGLADLAALQLDQKKGYRIYLERFNRPSVLAPVSAASASTR